MKREVSLALTTTIVALAVVAVGAVLFDAFTVIAVAAIGYVITFVAAGIWLLRRRRLHTGSPPPRTSD
jgi:hypothetical protein